MKCAIVGVGNRLRGDDAAGLMVIEELRAQGITNASLLESDGDPGQLVHLLGEFDNVTLVDAVVSGQDPGTITRWTPETWDRSPTLRSSSHLVGVREALSLASVLGKLPEALEIIGIEGSSFAPMTKPTPPVASAVRQVAELLAHEHRAKTGTSADA